ncbi:MAG: hypothetical protein V3T70_10100, partial [Phycisphaerae bacterium]
EVLDIPCLVGDPLRGLMFHPQAGRPESWTHRSAWSVAMGLALRGTRWGNFDAESRGRTAAAVS